MESQLLKLTAELAAQRAISLFLAHAILSGIDKLSPGLADDVIRDFYSEEFRVQITGNREAASEALQLAADEYISEFLDDLVRARRPGSDRAATTSS